MAANEPLHVERGAPIPLWPDGAPGVKEHTPPDIPNIVPYLLEKPERHGAVVVCPGGGYAGRADHEGAPIAQWLNGCGISAFVCNYRVTPYQHPYPSLDASRAVRWVRFHAAGWNVKPDRIGILGFSAGGHLASTVGTHYDSGDPQAPDPIDRVGSRPDAMILCYPVITFGEFRHEGSMVNLLGANPPEDLRASLSNEQQVTRNTPPTFLWHTADDEGVPAENSLLMAEALRRNGVPFELHVFQSGPHGLGLAPEHPHVAHWAEVCGEWLSKLGF
jgi:acetyl esterase/lipase